MVGPRSGSHFAAVASSLSRSRTGFATDLLSKSIHIDDAQLVEAPANQFVFVARFELKRDQRAFDVDNTGQARDGPTDWCRREVTDLDKGAHCALPGFDPGQHRRIDRG